MRKFQILPSGIIKGGNFEYSYDPEYGFLSYKTNIEVRKWGITRKFEADGSQKIAKEEIESAKYNHVGAEIKFANLSGKVTKIEGSLATAAVTTSDIEAAGTAVFDLSGTYAELDHLEALGKVKVPVIGDVDFRLVLQKAPAFGVMAKKDVIVPVEPETKEEPPK